MKKIHKKMIKLNKVIKNLSQVAIKMYTVILMTSFMRNDFNFTNEFIYLNLNSIKYCKNLIFLKYQTKY